MLVLLTDTHESSQTTAYDDESCTEGCPDGSTLDDYGSPSTSPKANVNELLMGPM